MARLTAQLPVSVAVQPVLNQVRPQPLLLWASSRWPNNYIGAEDLRRFPEQHERSARRNQNLLLGSTEFRRALRTASRLWILDQYFDLLAAEPLKESLQDTNIKDLRINGMRDVTAQNVSDIQGDFTEILRASARGFYEPEVSWRDDLWRKTEITLHDRFAIVDEELWHFGATVGGSHRSINAFSCGWSVKETFAEEYFLDLWRERT
jgi:hypothetical protein